MAAIPAKRTAAQFTSFLAGAIELFVDSDLGHMSNIIDDLYFLLLVFANFLIKELQSPQMSYPILI